MISKTTAERVFRRDNYACVACGRSNVGQLVVHHRANRGMGGYKPAERASNYLTLCSLCNNNAESDDISSITFRERGIKVTKHVDLDALAKIPVHDYNSQEWLLDDEYNRFQVRRKMKSVEELDKEWDVAYKKLIRTPEWQKQKELEERYKSTDEYKEFEKAEEAMMNTPEYKADLIAWEAYKVSEVKERYGN